MEAFLEFYVIEELYSLLCIIEKCLKEDTAFKFKDFKAEVCYLSDLKKMSLSRKSGSGSVNAYHLRSEMRVEGTKECKLIFEETMRFLKYYKKSENKRLNTNDFFVSLTLFNDFGEPVEIFIKDWDKKVAVIAEEDVKKPYLVSINVCEGPDFSLFKHIFKKEKYAFHLSEEDMLEILKRSGLKEYSELTQIAFLEPTTALKVRKKEIHKYEWKRRD